MPSDVDDVPEAVSQAVSELRLAGVEGPYTVLLGAELYTLVSETSNHGLPLMAHLARIVDGDILWAPAIEGAVVLTTRPFERSRAWTIARPVRPLPSAKG